jgi:nitric oxide reductase large subunit
MSYQEARALVSLFSAVAITIIYTAIMAPRYPNADPYSPEIFHFWGSFFVILIVVSIIANIVIIIIFTILNAIATRQEEPPVTDERDHLIELKSAQIALYVFAAGFLVAMGSLVFSQPPSVMFILLLCGGVASSVVADISQFYFYRRGF